MPEAKQPPHKICEGIFLAGDPPVRCPNPAIVTIRGKRYCRACADAVMESTQTRKCEYKAARGFSFRACNEPATYEVGGKWYCKAHRPAIH